MATPQKSLPTVRIAPVTSPGEMAAAMAIREVVFIEEAAIDPKFERDLLDEGGYHILAWLGGHAVGTGRLVAGDGFPPSLGGSFARVGRMAVLAQHRRLGIGRMLLEALEARAREAQAEGIVLHAQLAARGFYHRLGYVAYGEIFDEAGLSHVRMCKTF